MSVTWTKSQKKVIDLRKRNILVSAAAGSGKTAVLVERIITMLTDDKEPVDVDRLLIVTFTEAAAAEMKERIRGAIEKKLEEEPDNEHLKQQATLIHNARITTIHSFCLSVIRDHFPMIGLDPAFRIGEEGELTLLRHDVLDELLEEEYTEGRSQFLDFVSAYGTGKNDKKIEELILKVYEYSRSYPDAQEWLHECVKGYELENLDELEESPYVDLLKMYVELYLEDARARLYQGIEICREDSGPYMYEDALEDDLRMVERVLGAETYQGLSEYMGDISWMKLPPNRDKTVSSDKADQVKLIRDEVKELMKELNQQYFYAEPEIILKDIKGCQPMVRELTSLVEKFAERFEEKKRTKNMIDFSDMEQYAMKILTEKTEGGFCPTAAAEEYQEQFLEIMIDEYQDSNLIQETILTSVSRYSRGEYNIFMVGDVKQSIYRFRLSRPELFMEKYDTYSTEDSDTQRIDLHKNFRSRAEVLESVNYIFRQIMTRPLGGIAYDEDAALYVGADYPEGTDHETEVYLIDAVKSSWEDRKREARVTAWRIHQLMENFQVTDKATGELRPVKYSDIVILTRSVRGFADVFTEVLNEEGIPAYAGTREGYFSALEVGTMLDYLRVLDNRRQDLPLTAVLRSPIGRCTDEELAKVKSEFPDVRFFEAVEKYRTEGEDENLRRKMEQCMGVMDRLREIVSYTPMHELLFRILSDTGYGDYVAAMPGGAQREANIEMLCEKARAFEATSYKGLFHFVRYIEELKKYHVDYGEANVEDEQSDTVRVMTIHKSKGLEFPVVFVAGMGKGFNMQDVRSNVVLHARLGIGMNHVELEQSTKSPSLIKKVIQKEETLESLGEELRVLYVALTRAKEKLIITGTVENLEKKLSALERVKRQRGEELDFLQLSKATNYWSFLLPALMRLTCEVPIKVQEIRPDDLLEIELQKVTKERIERAVLEQWDTDRVYDPEMKERLKEQFDYRYPYEEERGRKMKFTVSELKKSIYMKETMQEENIPDGEFLYEEPEVVPLLPRFLQEEEEKGGAARGTAYHRVLELLDFTEEYDAKSLKEAIESFREQGKITEETGKMIRVKDFISFFDTSARKRMAESARRGKLYKEQPFVLGVPASELYEQKTEEWILVQGIIDVYFEEEDGLVVLDYKTDRVSDEKELVDKYHAQLDYYAKALEQLTEKEVKEKLIYSFTLGKEIRL